MPVTKVGKYGEAYKGVLVQNIFTKGNQLLQISNSKIGDIIVLTRDAIALEMGVIELADRTKVPGGRTYAGEFTATVQLGNNQVRNFFETWYEDSINTPKRDAKEFKREGFIKYVRHNLDSSTAQGGGDKDLGIYLKGIFCSKIEYPEFDMSGGDEGDADATLNVTIQYDWAGRRVFTPNLLGG
jgi:hypothetical protein